MVKAIKIKWNKWDNIGTSNILLSNVYSSIEELQQDEKEREDKMVAETKAKIHDVNNLVVYIYNAYFCDLDPSCTKRIIEERTKELLGLDLRYGG